MPSEKQRYVFFRLDDVGLPDDAYALADAELTEDQRTLGRELTLRILDLFDRYQQKVVVAPVPWHCAKGNWEWLYGAIGDGMAELAQHGYRHAEHGSHEFGRRRTYEQQRRDIESGRQILAETFGFGPEIFVPPSNTYDLHTLAALSEAGVRTISAGTSRSLAEHVFIKMARRAGISRVRNYPISWHERMRRGILELSISVDATANYEKGILKTGQQLVRDVKSALKRHRVVGIMLHPWQYRTEAERESVEYLLAWMRSVGITARHLREIASSLSAESP